MLLSVLKIVQIGELENGEKADYLVLSSTEWDTKIMCKIRISAQSKRTVNTLGSIP